VRSQDGNSTPKWRRKTGRPNQFSTPYRSFFLGDTLPRHDGRLARPAKLPLTHGQPHHQTLALKSSSQALRSSRPNPSYHGQPHHQSLALESSSQALRSSRPNLSYHGQPHHQALALESQNPMVNPGTTVVSPESILIRPTPPPGACA